MKIALTFLVLISLKANAFLVREPFEGVRPTGMGNAFIALADDANTLFYNPAGLARVKGVHFNLFDFTLGADSIDTLRRMREAFFESKINNLIRQEREFIRINIKPTLITPYFGFAVFNNAQGFFDLKGLTSSGIDIYAFNDVGVILGTGIPVGDYFSFGASIRVIERIGLDVQLTPAELLARVGTDLANFNQNMYNSLKNLAGSGYAAAINAGAMLKVPLRFSGKMAPELILAATAEDIGDTTFKSIGGHQVPPRLRHSYNFGSAFKYPLSKSWVWNTTFDLRHVLDFDMDFVKQFHLGIEFKNNIFGIRGGCYQGYPTFGASWEFPPHTKLHFSSYSVEIGNRAWERQNRWYLVQMVIGFNPF